MTCAFHKRSPPCATCTYVSHIFHAICFSAHNSAGAEVAPCACLGKPRAQKSALPVSAFSPQQTRLPSSNCHASDSPSTILQSDLAYWTIDSGWDRILVRDTGGFQPFGLPQFNLEPVIYARKGTPVFASTKAFPLGFQAPRGRHSEKPEVFYEMIRKATDGKRLDMFSRRQIEGFDVWGNEV